MFKMLPPKSREIRLNNIDELCKTKADTSNLKCPLYFLIKIIPKYFKTSLTLLLTIDV